MPNRGQAIIWISDGINASRKQIGCHGDTHKKVLKPIRPPLTPLVAIKVIAPCDQTLRKRMSLNATEYSWVPAFRFTKNCSHVCSEWNIYCSSKSLQRRQIHQPHDGLLKSLPMRRSKKTSNLRVTGICAGNSPVTGEFPHKGPVMRKMFPFDYVIML